jgi:membrane protease YdiL (CAAX protease family)
MIGLGDHLFVVLFAILFPLYIVVIWYPRFKESVATGTAGARTKGYVYTMAIQWFFAAVLVFMWIKTQRSFADLGILAPGGWGFWVGVVVAALAFVALILQYRSVMGSPEKRAETRKQFESVSAMLPKSRQEMTAFTFLSITAGICEEILYRGFLIWYLSQISGIVFAVIVSSMLFGLGHLYQGSKGLLQTAGVGLIMAGLYVLTGSIWIPIFVHAFFDINMGQLAHAVMRADEPEPIPSAAVEQ